MNYRYRIILKEVNDYMRKADLSYMDFIKENDQQSLKLQFDEKGRLFIEEDVNSNKTDKLVRLLEDNGISVGIMSCVKWKPLPEIPELSH